MEVTVAELQYLAVEFGWNQWKETRRPQEHALIEAVCGCRGGREQRNPTVIKSHEVESGGMRGQHSDQPAESAARACYVICLTDFLLWCRQPISAQQGKLMVRTLPLPIGGRPFFGHPLQPRIGHLEDRFIDGKYPRTYYSE